MIILFPILTAFPFPLPEIWFPLLCPELILLPPFTVFDCTEPDPPEELELEDVLELVIDAL